MLTEMKLHAFTIDTLTNKPLVLLKSSDEEMTVPIWLGSADAIAIALELVGRDLYSRGEGGDLLSALLKEADISMGRIVIDGVTDGAFSASIQFCGRDGDLSVKVRPSEAIVASVKYRLPLLISDSVIAQASTDALHDEDLGREQDERRFVDFLENLKREDFGKLPM